jgi:hypothetical protein
VKTVEHDVEFTAEHMLYLVRAGISQAMPQEAASIQSSSAARIVETFRVRFAESCDAGVCKRLSNIVLEPANPFDLKAHRQVRQEAIILGTLVFTALGLAVYFNLNAIAR